MGCHTNSGSCQKWSHKSVKMRRFDPQTVLNLVDRGERGVVVRVCVAVCYRVSQCVTVCCSVVNGDLVDRGERGSLKCVCVTVRSVCYSVFQCVLKTKWTHSPKTVCANGCLMNNVLHIQCYFCNGRLTNTCLRICVLFTPTPWRCLRPLFWCVPLPKPAASAWSRDRCTPRPFRLSVW